MLQEPSKTYLLNLVFDESCIIQLQEAINLSSQTINFLKMKMLFQKYVEVVTEVD